MTTTEPAPRSGAAIPAGRLMCGLQLPIQSSLADGDAWEREARPRQLEAVVRAADAAGFFSLAVGDHVALPSSVAASSGATWYDPLTTLAWVAAMTQRVRVLAHGLVVPYRHPLALAKACMTLDALSAGRAILAVAAGDLDAEFAALGIDFAGRDRLLDDGLTVLREAFATESPEVTTASWKVAGVSLAPRPVQERLPIWVVGSSDAAIRRAAATGDGWLPDRPDPDDLVRQIDLLREVRAATVGDVPIDIGAVVEPLHLREGDAAPVVESFLGLAACGVNFLQIRFRARSLEEYVEQVHRFGEEVVPLLNPGAQPSERYEEPPFVEIARHSRLHVQAMETSDDPSVWGAIGNELLLLTTRGRTSGREHKVSLAYWLDPEGRPILVGSYAGAPVHPDWYLNLADRHANPDVGIRTRDRSYRALAEELEGAEYDSIWAQLTLDRPSYRNYAARTDRPFALIRLHEQPAG